MPLISPLMPVPPHHHHPCSIKIQTGGILVPGYPDCRGKWPLNKCRVVTTIGLPQWPVTRVVSVISIGRSAVVCGEYNDSVVEHAALIQSSGHVSNRVIERRQHCCRPSIVTHYVRKTLFSFVNFLTDFTDLLKHSSSCQLSVFRLSSV